MQQPAPTEKALLARAGVPQRAATWRLYWQRLKAHPLALVGTLVFCFFLLMAFIGPLVAPYEFQAQEIASRLQPPGAQHLFGTDQYGRDIFSRILVGSRGIFVLGGSGTLLAGFLGISLGLVSGYIGGLWDEVLMRILDIFLAFPPLLLALVILVTVVAIGIGWLIGGLIITESLFSYPGLGRLLLFAIQRRDLPLIQATTLLLVGIFILSNLVADILYAYLNPRIRYT
jgi:ABC-type dipeptide/oligopeptide/nickel transport system permease subunit